jgi:ferredoxin
VGPSSRVTLDLAGLEALLGALQAEGYEVVGPTLRDGAIVYDRLQSVAELPRGIEDEQEAGRYRLRPRGDDALFAYVVGPHSWKRYLHPPLVTLFKARRTAGSLAFEGGEGAPPRRAFFGVRPCELAAIAVQDRVLMGGPQVDPVYAARRSACLLIAVNCARPGGTCFCASLGTGPRAQAGFDLALTELLDGEHLFLVEVGTTAGAAMVQKLPHRPASDAQVAAAEAVSTGAASRMGRTLRAPEGLKERLYARYEDPAWDAVGARCLGCTNCTQVCPTCFCTSVVDATDLAVAPSSPPQAERRRVWDSCFTLEFSYIHGGSVRTSAGARYRQWLTHKLATWHDQFGSSGCVGCGRCITWCPAGIDITAEANALAAGPAPGR